MAAAHPLRHSLLDSASGLPDSTVMMVAMSSCASRTNSYHLQVQGGRTRWRTIIKHDGCTHQVREVSGSRLSV